MKTYTFDLTFKIDDGVDYNQGFDALNFEDAKRKQSIPGWLIIQFTRKAKWDFEAFNSAIADVRKVVGGQLISIEA